jgi:thioredoxin 1
VGVDRCYARIGVMQTEAGPIRHDTTMRTVNVACLCAAWCRVCDGYRAAFDAVRATAGQPGVALRWHWIDIEDEDALVGELDIETFPMLVIAEGLALRFAGPLTPEAPTLRRVLAACLDDPAPRTGADPALAAFVQGLAARTPD